ncbi:KH domain-containing protein [Thermofilum pendens]|uniref:KH, type 1, domain protein n=1 Tax=Thermofilum pendens (strain DSM 2475 / Hrk 5) TaxID=368408 RepID=A1RXI8_THEPD|nr:KH domain-containing protein [Thermofilum pendens]ABL77918.1 KH, type 1, domain protein [Thermofilum pendens Hrk 5]
MPEEGQGVSPRGKLPVPVEQSRIGYIIGKDGSNKRRLEETFNVKLDVDSATGVVYVEPGEGATPYNVFRAKKALEAISIGFTVDDALLLGDDAYDLEVIDLSEVSKRREDLSRIKARIIGTEGRFKKTLEDMTGARIVIGEKAVGIIGDFEQNKVVKEALERLIAGQSHQSVMKFLERMSFELKRRRTQLWERMQGM